MRFQLLWKLFGINLLVIGVVILILWLAIDYLAAGYFVVLMKEYHVAPEDLNRMFLGATHRYLLLAGLAASALAGLLSFWLTRKVLSPLSQMVAITRDFASGRYTARARVIYRDGVGELAAAFNQMADNLQRVERLRKTMVVDVAHELRTPLTNMRGYLEALRDGVVAPSQDVFESLHEETLRLANLVEDLLRLSQADAARTTLHRARIDLAELTSQILDLFRLRFAAKAIAVEADLAAAGGRVLADPAKASQAITNLLQNAWQYTPRGGAVRVAVGPLPGGVKWIVSNSGEGIAEGDLPFIFERFYRAERSRSREHGGAGIGLAIVKELIEAHGGELGAESSPAETRIWFTLPA